MAQCPAYLVQVALLSDQGPRLQRHDVVLDYAVLLLYLAQQLLNVFVEKIQFFLK